MNIYVGNLSYEVTEEDLKEAFEVFGEVDTVKGSIRGHIGTGEGHARGENVHGAAEFLCHASGRDTVRPPGDHRFAHASLESGSLAVFQESG